MSTGMGGARLYQAYQATINHRLKGGKGGGKRNLAVTSEAWEGSTGVLRCSGVYFLAPLNPESCGESYSNSAMRVY